MDQPGNTLTSGNLGVWGLLNGSLDNFQISDNHKYLLDVSGNRALIIFYHNTTDTFLLIVLVLTVVLLYVMVSLVLVVSLEFGCSFHP